MFKADDYRLKIKALGATLEETAEALDIGGLTTQLAALKAETDALKESAALVATKIDAMLDILHTVFMAQNLPAGSKQVIDGFYTNARYAETQQRAAIVKQVEDLKAQLASMTAAMAEKVDSAETTVKKIVGAKSTETQTVKPAVNLK